MKWVTIGKIHIRAEQILTFHWQLGKLYVWYICEPAECYEWPDHNQKLYRKLCKQLGIEPAVEPPYGLDEKLDAWPYGEE
jgi:hypothetical protein